MTAELGVLLEGQGALGEVGGNPNTPVPKAGQEVVAVGPPVTHRHMQVLPSCLEHEFGGP